MRHLIGRLSSFDREKRKLALSLGANALTRIPGAVGVVFFLPVLRFGLGTDDYAALLASIALGAAATFMFGGFSLIGRRLIGEAYARGDERGEAEGFVSLLAATCGALLVTVALTIAYQAYNRAGLAITIVSLLPIVAAFLNSFDNIRAAYNEHYVTALLQFVLQIALYSIGFLVPAVRHHVVLAAFIMQGHLILASLVAGGLLLRGRAYLVRGAATAARRIVSQGLRLALADGVLMTTLSLSVVWLHAVAPTSTSAWFATVVRVFQTFLVPVLLLLMPLSSYIRLLWGDMSPSRRTRVVRLTLVVGIVYGAVMAVALSAVNELYVARTLRLQMPGGWLQFGAIAFFFAGIIAYKSYSSIAYLILDVSHLSFWTSTALLVAIAAGLAVAPFVSPFDALSVYAAAAGTALLLVLVSSVVRYDRSPERTLAAA